MNIILKYKKDQNLKFKKFIILEPKTEFIIKKIKANMKN